MFSVDTVSSRPYADQRPGTSGLRKRVSVFRQPSYLENYLQSIFDCLPEWRGGTLVLGGDGRYFNELALQYVIRLAAGNGIARLLVGRNGVLSTPAASCLIRRYGANGGLTLTASHCPGGPAGDFGIKLNLANGGPAPVAVSDAIFQRSRVIAGYRQLAAPDLDLTRIRTHRVGGTVVEVVDPVADYAALLEQLFDFDRIADLLGNGVFVMRFDARNSIAGLYAQDLLQRRLGAPNGTVIRPRPLADFGGEVPDVDPLHTGALIDSMYAPGAPDFAATCDADVDRHLILGAGCKIAPGDSLALLVANAHLVPAYSAGLAGVARSLPTSRAVDRVAADLGIRCFETPTGWKYFCNLLDAGHITLCGEEAFSAGADHVREKDGLWSVLFWLNLLASTGQSVAGLARRHWCRFGRDYALRYDFAGLQPERATRLLEALRGRLPELQGRRIGGERITLAEEFVYRDAVDGSVSGAEGIRLVLGDRARIVYRLSGTSTRGATVRIYLDRHERDPSRHDLNPAELLADLARSAVELADVDNDLAAMAPQISG